MPLLDHFHPPLSKRRPWSGFHHVWASNIAGDLNSRMPVGFFAQPFAHFGIEVDVATFDDSDEIWQGQSEFDRRWLDTMPTATVPFAIATDEIEVFVYQNSEELILAGAIELVSPSNKKQPGQRDAFNAKCESYMRAGLGVVVIDVVTDRLANLHAELLARLNGGESGSQPHDGLLSAISYRPTPDRLDIWREPLAVGGDLPELPLWLKAGPCLTVDLAITYRQTREKLLIGDDWD